MKTVTINLITELKIWLSIFILSNLLNALGIVIYKTEWKELYSQLGFVFLLSCAIYLVAGVLRLMVRAVRKKQP
jgi:hypothetical protein